MSKKISPQSCLFCVNSSTSVRKFKITEDYGSGNTIRYDLTSFLGHQIECYLKDDDVLCSNCMNFFEHMAYMKRQLIDFLCDRDESADIKMQGFSDIWKGFTKFAGTLVKFNQNSGGDETWDNEISSRCQTPNPVIHTYSEPYNEDYESKFMEKERRRSRSAAPSEGRSEADSEVRRLFRRKRKARGHNWTRRKGEQKSRALSKTYDYDYERNCYSAPQGNRRSSVYPRSESGASRPASRRKPKIAHGEPLRTRSVSRRESNKFYCNEPKCDNFFEDLDNLTIHKVFGHNIVARFNCYQCPKTYTSQEELDIHSRVHDTDILHCFQCGIEVRGTENLQNHLNQHQKYSIDCEFCYLSFLSKLDLSKHHSNEHKGKTRKKVRRQISTILKSVVNREKIKEPNIKTISNNNIGEKKFESRILLNERSPSPEQRFLMPTSPAISREIISIRDSPAITISDASPLILVDNFSPIAVSSEKSVIELELSTDNIEAPETPSDQIVISSDNTSEMEIVIEEHHIDLNELTEDPNPIVSDSPHLSETLSVHSEPLEEDVETDEISSNPQLTELRPVVVLVRL